MLRAALAAGLLLVPAAIHSAPEAATPPPEERPGYGVVEAIVPLDAAEGEASASAGASRDVPRGTGKAERYLIRVRMDDGTVQIRSVSKREVREGERVLITNAGDIVPE